MNEMDLLIRMRAEVPLAPPAGRVEATVLAAIASEPPARRTHRPGREVRRCCPVRRLMCAIPH